MTEHTLKTFARAYVDWLDRGAPQDRPFERNHGLCYAVFSYAGQHGLSLSWEASIHIELYKAFSVRRMHRLYPFGANDFAVRADAATMHECPKRIAFVREIAQ